MLIDYCKPERIYDVNELLFPSHKGGGQIGVASLNHMVKKWCDDAGLHGNFGSHTLRKTWAYIQYTVFGADLAHISDQLNHSDLKTTYRYLGIMPQHIQALYANYI
jgi:integrase